MHNINRHGRRLSRQLTNMTGFAGVGGFGVGSDLFYDLNLNIGYQWNKAIGTGIGYRLYDVDYNKDDFLYDVKQQGWLIGLTWAF